MVDTFINILVIWKYLSSLSQWFNYFLNKLILIFLTNHTQNGKKDLIQIMSDHWLSTAYQLKKDI
jgi:hypothetical protein